MEFIRKLLGIKSKAEKKLLKDEFNRMKLELKDKVAKLTKPAVHLIKTKNKTNSKFGGRPIVDDQKFVWPTINGRPMSFLAQLDLGEISKPLKYSWLKKSGSILFFYDVKEMPWGFDPKDKGKWKVIYQDSPSLEVDYPDELDKELILKETYIDARKIDLLPSYEDKSVQDLNLTDEEIDLYFEIGNHHEEFNSYKGLPAHQIGGFPKPVQGDEMQFEAEQASNGIYMGDSKAYKNANDRDFESAKHKWQLLLQFDSDDELDVMWGDTGMLYFWVDKDRSNHNDFEDVWLILQCS
jgi:uncharacterized protein YwqG